MSLTTSQVAELDKIQNFEGKYPLQLWSLFMIEMWERFCFYGMRGMLTIFMVRELSLLDTQANLQYGAIQAFVYAFTFIGGLFADKILGLRKSLVWGALLMIIGGFTIAAAPKQLFYLGICFSIVGTGFFKPNVSSMVGQLYKEGDSRRDAGFSLFYAGINLGAMLGGILMVWVGIEKSWNLAFALVGVVMIISLITLWFTKGSLGPIGLSPITDSSPLFAKKSVLEWATYGGSIAVIPLIYLLVTNTTYTDWVMYISGPLALLYVCYEMTKYDAATVKKLIAAIVFIIFSVFFWAFFEQSGGSLALFADYNLNDSLLGIKILPNVVNNSANSLFIIIFAAPLGLVWVWLANRKLEPDSVVKFGLGFLLLALGFFVFYYTVHFADKETGKTSLNVFTVGYLVVTFAELCLSPIGLSLMTKLSPQPMQGLMMGMWFLASAYGQYIAGLLGAGMSVADKEAPAMEKLVSYTGGYYQLAIYAAVLGVLLIAISPLVRKLMGAVR